MGSEDFTLHFPKRWTLFQLCCLPIRNYPKEAWFFCSQIQLSMFTVLPVIAAAAAASYCNLVIAASWDPA